MQKLHIESMPNWPWIINLPQHTVIRILNMAFAGAGVDACGECGVYHQNDTMVWLPPAEPGECATKVCVPCANAENVPHSTCNECGVMHVEPGYLEVTKCPQCSTTVVESN